MGCSKLAALLTLALLACANARAPKKIVRGNNAYIDEFPSTVVIKRTNGVHLCGGTLISNKHVLSAAHCFTSGSRPAGNLALSPTEAGIYVIVGHDNLKDSQKFEHYAVAKINIHDDWQGDHDDGNSPGDMAILTLKNEIAKTGPQKVASLGKIAVKADTEGTVVGWGVTRDDDTGGPSDQMQKATLKVYDYDWCKKGKDPFIPKKTICTFADERDLAFCMGDSGGPFYNNKGEVIGVVSYNYDCTGKQPNVFTDVFQYESWIKGIVGKK